MNFLEIIIWSLFTGIFIFILIFGYSFVLSFITKIPYLPSKTNTIKKIANSIEIKPNSTVFDLGCGDMKFLIHLEKFYNFTGIGLEISPIPYLFAKVNLKLNNSNNKIYYKNIFQQDLSSANYIFTYLTPPILHKLSQKIISECKPNTLVISNSFSIPNLKLVQEIPKSKQNQKIYIYSV
jgi:hypothetical protein